MLRKQKLFIRGEIENRLLEANKDLWYLCIISKNDVTKWEAIRHTNYIDVMNQLIVFLENFGK